MLEVNVLGVHLCCSAVIPGMLERGAGRIVITGSGAAYLPGAHSTPYPTSKAAVCRYGETLANELAGRIPVFFFSPGLVQTEMTGGSFPDDAPWTPPELAPQLVRVLASGRADALAGRYIHAEHDDIEDLIRRADEIRENDLNAIRLQPLSSRFSTGSLKPMRLALAQINTIVGDLDGNRERILAAAREARGAGADLVLLPELAVTGYPPEDLLLRPGFIRAAEESLQEIARETHGLVALVGFPHFDRDLFNACAVCADGEVKAVYRKRFLPNYGVFDEDRYFAPARDLLLLELGGTLVGPTICEDMWQPGPPATELALAGAQLLVNISASPFHVGREREREEMFATRARDNACFVAFCNAVGGQDELIFDGHSLVLDEEGHVLARAPGFEEALLVVDIDPADAVGRRLRDVRRRALARERGVDARRAGRGSSATAVPTTTGSSRSSPSGSASSSRCGSRSSSACATTCGKNGFSDVVVGVSGGIDSALTAALAVEALGAERVHCVSMPSRLLVRGDARRRAAAGRESRHRLPRAADRAERSRPSTRSWPRASPAASPTWPRRTCRRGSAASC